MEEWECLNNQNVGSDKLITQEYRNSLMMFNTDRFHWCFYDVKTDRLYSQYCTLLMENAYNYLLGLGHIDKDKVFIKEFSE